MEQSGTEVTLKIRSAIINKLVELGVYVDEDLPDYIMVMVANKKTRSQMALDLSLFLGSNTDGFTKWLHSILDNVQSGGSDEVKEKKRTDDSSSLVSSKNVPSREERTKPRSPAIVPCEDIATVPTIILTNVTEAIEDGMEDLITCRNEMENDDLLAKELQEETLSSHPHHSSMSHTIKKEQLSPPGVSIVSPLQRRPIPTSTTTIPTPLPLPALPPTDLRSKISSLKPLPKSSMRVKPILHRNSSATTAIPSVSSIVRRPNRPFNFSNSEEEDEYDPCRPSVGSVASVVKVTDRRSSVPRERQANKLLLLKAMDDANKSMRAKGSVRIEPYQPTPIVKQTPKAIAINDKPSPIVDQFEVIDIEEDEQGLEEQQEQLKTSPRDPIVYVDASVTTTPTTIPTMPSNTDSDLTLVFQKSSSYLKAVAAPSEKSDFIQNSLKGLKRKQETLEEEMELTYESIDPSNNQATFLTQFVVTLDGVDPVQIFKKCKRRVVSSQLTAAIAARQLENGDQDEDDHQNMINVDQMIDPLENYLGMEEDEDGIDGDEDPLTVYQDEFLDEDFDQDSYEVPVNNEQHRPAHLKKRKIKTRCQFWPSCKYGEKCIYNHPSELCTLFPDCKFGARCKAIHPYCKYDVKCQRPNCPFTHTSKPIHLNIQLPPPLPVIHPFKPVVVQCKFFPNCSNVSCPFTHPKPCHYGANCQVMNCSFIHKIIPRASKLKWISPAHILNTTSERRYAAPNKHVNKMTVEIAK